MRPKVSTTRYESSHGMKPSGEARWAFFFDGNTDIGTAFFTTAVYSEAKRRAGVEAKRRGASTIEVGP